MQKARTRKPMWTIGVLLMVPLVFGQDIAHSLPPLSSGNAEQQKRFHQSVKGAGKGVVVLPRFHQFHANDSLIELPVPCKHEEKLCFHYNMLYKESKKWCVDLVDHHVKFSSGHVVAAERMKLKCEGYVMACDDKCYRKDVVQDLICGCDAEPTLHFINGVECRCTPSAPIHVKQPTEQGRCRIPDLRFPDENRTRFYRNPHQDIQGVTSDNENVNVSSPLQFHCTPEQLNCFAGGKVWVAKPRQRVEQEPGDCHPLLEEGHCPEEHVVALDVQAAREGRVETTCAHVRGGCPEGQVRMPFDDKCHSEKDIKSITNGKLFRNQFGFFVISPDILFSLTPLPVKVESSGMCAIKVRTQFCAIPFHLINDKPFSKTYEVHAAPSFPDM